MRRHELMNKAKQKNMQINTGEFKAPKKETGDSPKKRTRRRSRADSCSSDSGSEVKKWSAHPPIEYTTATFMHLGCKK